MVLRQNVKIFHFIASNSFFRFRQVSIMSPIKRMTFLTLLKICVPMGVQHIHYICTKLFIFNAPSEIHFTKTIILSGK